MEALLWPLRPAILQSAVWEHLQVNLPVIQSSSHKGEEWSFLRAGQEPHDPLHGDWQLDAA